jgi:hypothetical protein
MLRATLGFSNTRVTFGVTSSPFLLGAVIDYHLERCLAESDQNEWYGGDFFDKLRKSFYVDNCVTSLPDYSALRLFIETSTEVFAKAKFELRGWENTDPDLKNHLALQS